MFHSKYEMLRDMRETTKILREVQEPKKVEKVSTKDANIENIKDMKEPIKDMKEPIKDMKEPVKDMKEPIKETKFFEVKNKNFGTTKCKIKQKNKETCKIKQKNKETKYKKLVLAGGGLKGLAYVGAINALRKLRALDYIDEVVGCSIGAVFALLIILGYSDDELHDFLLHFHYDQLKDLDFFKIITEWGVESGSKIETFLIQLIKNKTGLDNPTFSELYNKVGSSLIVNAVALDEFNLHYFGLRESPNMKVVKAIRASISVPGLFTPVKYNNHLFVDGGLLNNFPIDYFKDKGILGSSILGLCFDQVVRPPGLKNLNGVNAYLSSIIGCILNRIERTGETERKIQYLFGDNPMIISIPTGDITAFQATIDRTKRLYLYHHGEQAVFKAFESVSMRRAADTSNTRNKLRRSSI